MPVPFSTVRLVNRLLLGALARAVVIGRMGRDFVDALILMAVVQANVAPVMRDAELNKAYATFAEPPPDSLRRPVSVNAIAQSLRLPYETARRRILRLARAGACEVSAAGVMVPVRELTTPEHMMAMMQLWEVTRGLYYRLGDAGVLEALVSRAERERWGSNTGEMPVRAAIRAASDFVLRFSANVERLFDSLLEAVVWLTIMLANTETLPDAEAGGPGEAAAEFVDDDHRRPVRAAEVAERLGAPQETVRRYVDALVRRGFCVRTRRGLVIPAEVLGRPNATRAMRDNLVNLQRLLAALARMGVLDRWDRERESLSGRAAGRESLG